MKAFETFTPDELKAKFKPIEVTLGDWNFGPSIKKVVDQRKTSSGEAAYVVKLKDNQITKISKKNLSKKYGHLLQQFQQASDNQQQEKATAKRLPIKRSRVKQQQEKATANKLPIKRGRVKQPVIVSAKKIRKASNSNSDVDELESDGDSGLEYREKSVDFEANNDSEGTFSGSNSGTETADTAENMTQRGRKTVKPKSFMAEFHYDMLDPSGTRGKSNRKANFGPAHHIPLYEDETFIHQHSEYCYRCHKKGAINGKSGDNTEVYFGSTNPCTRLLLCGHCSLSFHNNCVSGLPANFNKETNDLRCQKCLKRSKCHGCKKTVTTKEDSAPLPLRCSVCFRGFHQKCIISGASAALRDQLDESMILDMYQSGKCVECNHYTNKKVESVLSERQVEGTHEYFVKWKHLSYRKAEWVNADWVEQAYPITYRGYLSRKEKGRITAYSDDWLMIDRIIDVKWADKKAEKASKVLAIFKDRDYGEACWDEPPSEEETALYSEYQKALKRYLQAMQVTPPKNMKSLISQVRSKAKTEGYSSHELKVQPKFVEGGTLMGHQMEALNWLLYQWENQKSCILADDMGLGKTIQIITFLYCLFKKYGIYPFYVVVPNSTATNWIREFEKWAPDLTVAPYYGDKTARKLSRENEIFDRYGRLKCHVVVATYESALETTLKSIFWPVLIVDESQRLKNDNSLLFKHLNSMQVDHTVLLTGTPLQNNLRELFNIMHFIHPKLFQGEEAKDFEELTKAQVDDLHERLRPFFLRRTKEQVLKTLPPRYELIVPLSMSTLQKEVYKQCLSGEIQETLAQVTQAKRQAGLSNIFVNLRKVLNHPYLLDGVETSQSSAEEIQKNMINASAKLKLFHQMLPKLIERGHRMLIFSTMTRALDVLEDYLHHENIKYARIDGSTMERDRVRRIDAFNAANSELKVFLLSTRAGGVGINLATADTIIIWDSDFNPYADMQAIGRAHRIGQTKMVLIYRFMTRLSVEEKVLQIAKKRMALEHVIVERMAENEDDDLEDIESILKYGTEALFSDDTSKDIVYDEPAIENLLDREQYRETAEDQKAKEVEELEGRANDKSGMNFSFAKVWTSNGTTEELNDTDSAEEQRDTDFWEQFLLEQQALLEKKKEEKRQAEMNLGRGARKRNNVKYIDKKKDNDQSDKDFVLEEGASDSDETIDIGDNSDLGDLEIPLDRLKIYTSVESAASQSSPTPVVGLQNIQTQSVNSMSPNSPSPQGQPVNNTLPKKATPSLSEEKKKAKDEARVRQKQLRDMEKALKYYTDSMYGILISYIGKDLRHIQAQAEQSLLDNTFSIDLFNSSKDTLANHIQNSITAFAISNAEREREADIVQSRIDPQLAQKAFEGKKLIIQQNVARTKDYIFSEFDKLGAYLVNIMHQRDARRRESMAILKTEIEKLQQEREKVKERHVADMNRLKERHKFEEKNMNEKHTIEERVMESKHKRYILQLAGVYNIYTEGVSDTNDTDKVAEKLIEQVLNSNKS